MLNRMTGKLAVALVAAMGFAGQASADSLGVNYAFNNSPNGTVNGTAGYAGYAQSGWVNFGGWQVTVPYVLTDINGTTVDMVWDTAGDPNQWNQAGTPATDNERLTWSYFGRSASVNITDINGTFDTYTLVVYYSTINGNSHTENLQVTGQPDRSVRSDGNLWTAWTESTSVSPPELSNVAVYTGLTADSLTVGFDGIQIGISAIQLVSEGVIPEPASLALLGLGGVFVLRRRRSA